LKIFKPATFVVAYFGSLVALIFGRGGKSARNRFQTLTVSTETFAVEETLISLDRQAINPAISYVNNRNKHNRPIYINLIFFYR